MKFEFKYSFFTAIFWNDSLENAHNILKRLLQNSNIWTVFLVGDELVNETCRQSGGNKQPYAAIWV